MGFYSNTTTTETTIPPPTSQELALMDLSQQQMMAYMSESGFEVTKKTTTWGETPDAQNFASRRSQLQAQQEEASRTGQAGIARNIGIELQRLQIEEDQAREGFTPETTFETREKASFEVERLRKIHGPDSAEYQQALHAYEEQKVQEERQTTEIKQMIMDRTQKLLKGDFSLNRGEQKFMDEMMGPLKQAALNAVNYIQEGARAGNLNETAEEFFKRVDGTKMNLGDALIAIEHRVRETGQSMEEALDDEVQITKDLIKMGIEDFTSENRKNIGLQAAMLGRSPTDPDFQLELQERATREISKSNLQLGQYAAGQRMGIRERTGAGLEGVARSRAGYAEDAARLKGQTEMGLAETQANIRKDLAYGLPPTAVGLGMNVNQYQDAVMQQRLANIQAGQQMPLNNYQIQQRERLAQTTSTTTQSTGLGNIFTSLIGAGISGTAAAFSGGMMGGK